MALEFAGRAEANIAFYDFDRLGARYVVTWTVDLIQNPKIS